MRSLARSLVPFALVVFLAAALSISSAQPPSSAPSAHRLPHVGPSATEATSLSSARLSRSSSNWLGGPTTAATGELVSVYVSPLLLPELGTPQTWADFIGGLMHGPEIASLTAYIATLDEVQSICGEYALGCYAGDRMVSIGDTAYGISAAEVVRHEYGHHVAAHRANSPWAAIDWGPKNWASSAGVCRRTDDGSAFPGDEGDNYTLNPGEAWAETYRVLDERRQAASGSGWEIVDQSFYPDDAALAAAERDVLAPWTSPHTIVLRRSFTRKSGRVWLIPVQTPLDGTLDLVVSLPRGGLHDVAVLDAERRAVLATGLWSSRTTKRITVTICGQRSLALRVTQRGAFGRVVVSTTVP